MSTSNGSTVENNGVGIVGMRERAEAAGGPRRDPAAERLPGHRSAPLRRSRDVIDVIVADDQAIVRGGIRRP